MSSKMTQGKLIVFSAPSGSGKTTIVRHLLAQKELNLEFSVSATSRAKRGTEVDTKDYYFLSSDAFKQHIKSDDFLEWEEVYRDNFYGTLKAEVERIWALGKHVIFDIDVSGGLRIKRKFPEQTLAIFVKPPSIDELKKRKTKLICELQKLPRNLLPLLYLTASLKMMFWKWLKKKPMIKWLNTLTKDQ
jgi:guanylate kinase